MKALKAIFLVIVVIFLSFVLGVLQIQFALQKTVLSPEYFEKMYDQNDMEEAIARLIESEAADIASSLVPDEGGAEAEMDINLNDYIDAEWLSEEIGEALKQTYGYFMGEEDLPAIDIEPVKEMILDMASDQMLAYGNVAETLKDLDLILETYNLFAEGTEAEIDEEALSQLAEQTGGMGLSTDLLETVILTSIDLDDDINSEERAKIIATEIISQQMGLEEMSDELDLDDIMDEAYPEGENPLEAVRTIIGAVRNMLFYALMIIFLLLVLVVVFTAFKPAQIFGWLSAPLIAGGLSGVCIWLLGGVLPTIGGFAEIFGPETFGGSENLAEFAGGYLKGIFSFALIQGVVILAVGIVFAIVAGIISGHARKRAGESPDKPAGLVLVRVIVVIVLMAAAVFAAARYYIKIYDEIDEAVNVLENAQASENMAEIISESINFPLGDFMGGEE